MENGDAEEMDARQDKFRFEKQGIPDVLQKIVGAPERSAEICREEFQTTVARKTSG
jgi:ribosomal protein L2